MSDIDDLLDDIEANLRKKSNLKQAEKKKNVAHSDDLINDLDVFDLKLDNQQRLPKNKNPLVSSSTTTNNEQKLKCFPIYLSGTSTEQNKEEHTCNNLRCIQCDFDVLRFNDSEWTSNVDYLFFRNHMPDKKALKQRLRTKQGCTAYACQCQWININSLTNITAQYKELKWSCMKH
ncbi:unnamed protein product [Didymodactylos carnosus]|uniref:Cilia- and flagella-associated protein 418 n=1 Tax=Didymodactylos carnosus TaxID=1234261 RepID=A0A813QRW7_9BILA|nr:unnamed protein product [Didymodactylos carnosus]CAF1170227.1 unnamed protein product [Didymodactylos carnosus]CAF3553677.1 unnamed protein product [Didymodactylos carnosus]CAF3981583.1 unnamed protein product [Didymodactylos carnosus]